MLQQFANVIARAPRDLASFNIKDSVDLFCWLCRYAQTLGKQLDEQLSQSYVSHIEDKISLASEHDLATILKTLSDMLNKNKLARDCGDETQMQIERLAHSLLEAAIPGLSARHRHMSFHNITHILGAYGNAKLYRKSYATLFEAMVPDVIARAKDQRMTLAHRQNFCTTSPWLLWSYSQTQCEGVERVFHAHLDRLEEMLDEVDYLAISFVGYSVALVGTSRPSFWALLLHEVRTHGGVWPIQGLGLILAACKKRLMSQETAVVFTDLVNCVGGHLSLRRGDVGFQEVSELIATLAYVREPDRALLLLACDVISASREAARPRYVASIVHSLASVLCKTDDAQVRDTVLDTVRALGPELRKKLFLCEPEWLCLVAEASASLSVLHAPFDTDCVLYVLQRECIRQLDGFDMDGAVRFARHITTAGTCQPWFFPELLKYFGAHVDDLTSLRLLADAASDVSSAALA